MATIRATVALMNQALDYAARMPRSTEQYDPHPGLHGEAPWRRQRDINRGLYEALQQGLNLEKNLQDKADTSVQDYRAGKKSFQDMLKKVTDTTAEDGRTVTAFLKKKSTSTSSNYNVDLSSKATGTTGKIVDLQS